MESFRDRNAHCTPLDCTANFPYCTNCVAAMELEAALSWWPKGLVEAALAFDKDVGCILTVPGLCSCTVLFAVCLTTVVL